MAKTTTWRYVKYRTEEQLKAIVAYAESWGWEKSLVWKMDKSYVEGPDFYQVEFKRNLPEDQPKPAGEPQWDDPKFKIPGVK